MLSEVSPAKAQCPLRIVVRQARRNHISLLPLRQSYQLVSGVDEAVSVAILKLVGVLLALVRICLMWVQSGWRLSLITMRNRLIGVVRLLVLVRVVVILERLLVNSVMVGMRMLSLWMGVNYLFDRIRFVDFSLVGDWQCRSHCLHSLPFPSPTISLTLTLPLILAFTLTLPVLYFSLSHVYFPFSLFPWLLIPSFILIHIHILTTLPTPLSLSFLDIISHHIISIIHPFGLVDTIVRGYHIIFRGRYTSYR